MKMLETLNPIKLIGNGVLLLVALSLCSTGVVRAEISVSDNWDKSGKVSVKTGKMTVVFGKENAGVIQVYSISGQANKKSMQMLPFHSQDSKVQSIVSCEIIKSTAKEVEIMASFSTDQKTIDGTFLFDDAGTIQVKPTQNFNGISVLSSIKHAVLPGRILDDVLYDPGDYPNAGHLHIPVENLLMGLLDGRDGILVCTIPSGKQQVRLLFEDGKPEERAFRAVEIELDEKSVYLTVLSAPGIWHKQELLDSYLEKEVELPWKRPFPAKWKTHLLERGEVETAYAFQSGKQSFWRAGLGSPTYPAWFEGDKAFLRFSKQFPPVGRALIYPLEGRKDTPVEFATRCLGGEEVPSLRRSKGLKRPTSVVGCESCDGHDYMTRTFRMGLQNRLKKYLREGLDDFQATTNAYAGRLLEYHNFIESMKVKVKSWREQAVPELQPFMDKMKDDLETLDEEYSQRMGDMTAPELLRYQTESIERLKALAEEKGVEVYPEAAFLIEENHLSVVLTEGVAVGAGGQMREWSRQVAYSCVDNADAVKYAVEIRKELRNHLGSGVSFECVY